MSDEDETVELTGEMIKRLAADTDSNKINPSDFTKPRLHNNVITITEQITIHIQDEQPQSTGFPFSTELKSRDSEIYSRRKKATNQWQPLDLGWNPSPGIVLIKNDEGKFLHRLPTQEEKDRAASLVIHVKYAETDDKYSWLIRPGESFRSFPNAAKSLVIRCPTLADGEIAKYQVWIAPE